MMIEILLLVLRSIQRVASLITGNAGVVESSKTSEEWHVHVGELWKAMEKEDVTLWWWVVVDDGGGSGRGRRTGNTTLEREVVGSHVEAGDAIITATHWMRGDGNGEDKSEERKSGGHESAEGRCRRATEHHNFYCKFFDVLYF